MMSSYFVGLGKRINCDFFSYDYSGYGASEGKPSENNMYADIEAAWDAMKNKLDIVTENIILFGQSFGVVPTVDLASRFSLKGVILTSPIASFIRLVFPQTKRTWFFDEFANVDKIEKVL